MSSFSVKFESTSSPAVGEVTREQGKMTTGQKVMPVSHGDDPCANLIAIAVAALFLIVSIVLWGTGAGIGNHVLRDVGISFFALSLTSIVVNTLVALKKCNSN